MGKASPSLFVTVADSVAFIKITGRANFTSSVHFKTVVNELRDRSFRRFVLDLTECVTMDSTFLGVMAGFALRLSGPVPSRASQDNWHLELFNPNPRIMDLLENLGVSHLFGVRHAAARITPEAPVQESNPSREELSKTCLEAHETLMAINPDNIPKFKEVTQFLAEDLKRLKSNP
jgi:anti-sigma B factor antagonist